MLSEDLEVSELAPLGAERIGAALDKAFPGWRSDEADEKTPFTCSLDDRVLVVETWSSTPQTVFRWLNDFATAEGLTQFDPQIEAVPKDDLLYAASEAARIRTRESADRWAREFDDLRRRAEADDAKAQCELAGRYSFGEGVKRDLKEAFRWYERAAINGSCDGMFNLATCYKRGEGVSRDIDAAVSWYTRAAEEDQMLAPFALGEIYLDGQDLPRDNDRAREYFKVALENGHPDAKAALRMLDEVQITPDMKKKAWKFWSR